ncbi:unnamed protein product [Discula destructiva]
MATLHSQAAETAAPHADASQHTNDASAPQPAPITTSAETEKLDSPAAAKGPALEPAVPETAAKEQAGPAPRASIQTDEHVNPPGFEGGVLSNDDLPSQETIRRISDYIVLDRHGKSHTFKSLYSGRNVARRVLIIFVRHFFCGNCQEYLRTLSASINAESLLGLPISTFIAVVGCGDPGLIDMYAAASDCPYPIYADPTRKLYQELGMVQNLALGERPAYMKKSLLKSSLDSIVQGVKQIRTGLVLRGGDQRQIGGEFLFEPVDINSPAASPVQEFDRKLRLGGPKAADSDAEGGKKHSRTTSTSDNDNDEIEEPHLVEEKKVTWCHRMRTTRDHVEMPELMEILGLNGQGEPIKDEKRWSKALELRKGIGSSMAKRMSHMGERKATSEGA